MWPNILNPLLQRNKLICFQRKKKVVIFPMTYTFHHIYEETHNHTTARVIDSPNLFEQWSGNNSFIYHTMVLQE